MYRRRCWPPDASTRPAATGGGGAGEGRGCTDGQEEAEDPLGIHQCPPSGPAYWSYLLVSLPAAHPSSHCHRPYCPTHGLVCASSLFLRLPPTPPILPVAQRLLSHPSHPLLPLARQLSTPIPLTCVSATLMSCLLAEPTRSLFTQPAPSIHAHPPHSTTPSTLIHAHSPAHDTHDPPITFPHAHAPAHHPPTHPTNTLTRRCQRPPHVLLVRKDEDGALQHEGVLDDGLELRCCLVNALPVLTVDYKDEAIGVVEVVAPQRTQLLLPPCGGRGGQRGAMSGGRGEGDEVGGMADMAVCNTPARGAGPAAALYAICAPVRL